MGRNWVELENKNADHARLVVLFTYPDLTILTNHQGSINEILSKPKKSNSEHRQSDESYEMG